MKNRRDMLQRSAVVAGLLASTGLFPQFAHAAFNKNAFDAKNVADSVKAYGAGALTESKDITITGPDIMNSTKSLKNGRPQCTA